MPLPELAYTISALRWYWLAAAAGLLLLAGLGMALAWPRIRYPRTKPARPVAAEALIAQADLPDGKRVYLDYIAEVTVTASGVRYRATPNGTILGTWPTGARLLWMGVHQEAPDWWHVWNPADWSQVGWTHKAYLRQT